jgi:predicted esterase
VTPAAFVFALALVLAKAQPSPQPATAAPTPTPTQEIASALVRLRDNMDVANRLMGEDQALDLGNRLAQDLEDYDEILGTYGADSAYWNDRTRNDADLDASLVAQVLAGRSDPLVGSRGLVERLITSKVDGTLQPFALYVPPSTGPSPALVVLLHGRPQYDSEILSGPQFRALADSTGSIIAAPYGRGFYDYYGVATDDVYQTAAEVANAFHIDPHKVYLVGYSMGAFSVFKVGPVHANEWAGVMAIAGAIVNSETTSVQDQLAHTPFYVVTGTADASIPTQYAQETAQYLAGVGIRTGLYVEKNGTHSVATLMPSLTLAWNDMLRGVVTHQPLGVTQGLSDMPNMITDPNIDRPTKP